MRVLITGAEGFAGRVLAEGLRARGIDVAAHVGVNPSKAVLSRFESQGIAVSQGERGDDTTLEKAARGVDAVVHAARDQRLRGSLRTLNETLVVPAEAALDAAQRATARRFVFISNEVVTSTTAARGYVDETLPHARHVLGAFAETMALTEALITAASGRRHTDTVVLRPGILWGPDDDEYLPTWIRQTRRHELPLIGDGGAIVPTTHIDNLVAATHGALVSTASAGNVYHVTDDERISARQFLTKLMATVGAPAPRRRVPYAIAYGLAWFNERFDRDTTLTRAEVVRFARNVQFNLQRARDDLHYDPVHIDAGLKRLAAWVQRAGGIDRVASGDVQAVPSID